MGPDEWIDLAASSRAAAAAALAGMMVVVQTDAPVRRLLGHDHGPRSSAGPRPAAHPATDRATAAGWVLSVLVVLVLLTQRVVLPVGETVIPLALPLQYAALFPLVALRAVHVDRLRTELFAGAVLLVLIATWVVASRGGVPSLTSLGLLLVLYAAWLFRTGGSTGADANLVGRTFVASVVVLAAVGVFQLLGQLAGVWTFHDYLADVVPRSWLASTFNFTNPLQYGSDVVKGNAFVLLEPSFLSQFCALAVAVGLVVRAPVWQLLVLLAGVASAVSGTGILLLGVVGLLVVLRAPQLLRPGYLVAGALVVAGVAASPLAQLLTSRAGETSQAGSSGYLRFVQPYTEVAQGLAADSLRYWVGAGAGSAERLLLSDRGGVQAGEAVVYTIVPKLAFEYGLLAAGVFVLFLVLSMLDRAPWPVVPGVVLVMIFFLSGSLLQPQTTVLAWALTGAVGSAAASAGPWRPPRSGPRSQLTSLPVNGTAL